MKKPKIAKAQGRSVEEWVGRTPDSRPPPRVLLRIFDRAHGKCHISGKKIEPGDKWEAEHVKRLEDGGENRENNLAPALVKFHKQKSKEERERAAKADAAKKRHLGVKGAPKRKIQSAGFAPVEKGPKAGTGRVDKSAIPPLPRINIFTGKPIK